VVASRSTERSVAAPSPAGRIVYAGAIAVLASLLLPWYGIPFSHGLSVTGLDSFGFAHVALLITVGAAVLLVARETAGRTLPRPLGSAELVIAAGAWAALLTAYLIVDRPDELAGSTEIGVRMGIFVALGGCAAIVVGGIRMRVEADAAAAARPR
jgi:membrane associated rhomboid family serine protease